MKKAFSAAFMPGKENLLFQRERTVNAFVGDRDRLSIIAL